MVTSESETLAFYDPDFYSDFYDILIDNVCNQTKDVLDPLQYQDCMTLSQKGMLQDGVITFMNNFQRRIRSAIEDLRVNSTLRYKE